MASIKNNPFFMTIPSITGHHNFTPVIGNHLMHFIFRQSHCSKDCLLWLTEGARQFSMCFFIFHVTWACFCFPLVFFTFIVCHFEDCELGRKKAKEPLLEGYPKSGGKSERGWGAIMMIHISPSANVSFIGTEACEEGEQGYYTGSVGLLASWPKRTR